MDDVLNMNVMNLRGVSKFFFVKYIGKKNVYAGVLLCCCCVVVVVVLLLLLCCVGVWVCMDGCVWLCCSVCRWGGMAPFLLN